MQIFFYGIINTSNTSELFTKVCVTPLVNAPEKNLLELSSIMINIKFRNGFDFFVFRTSMQLWST